MTPYPSNLISKNHNQADNTLKSLLHILIPSFVVSLYSPPSLSPSRLCAETHEVDFATDIPTLSLNHSL